MRERVREKERERERERESARLRGNLRAVLSLFFFPPLALVNGCIMWPQPGALGSVVDYRVSYGSDDWNDDADKFSLRIASEGVSSRLEMQRRVDEISAVQCRQS